MKRSVFLLVGFLSSIMSIVALSPAAHADDSRCPANRFCLYLNIDYGGGRAVFSGTDRNLGDNRYDSGSIVANSASSMINNTGHTVVLYDIAASGSNGCASQIYSAQPHSVDSTFVNNSANDKAECLIFS